MAKPVRSRRNNRYRSPLSSVMTLAWWRWRQTGFLLSIITMGVIASVMIACAIPLFTDVMATAGLRSTMRETPNSAEFEAEADSIGISSPVIKDIKGKFDSLLQSNLGSLVQTSSLELIAPDFSFASGPAVSTPSKQTSITMRGTDMTQVASHISHLQGHIANVAGSQPTDISVMMTPATAKLLQLSVGSTLPLVFTYMTQPSFGNFGYADTPPQEEVPKQVTVPVTAHVAGLFDVSAANTAYWHGTSFQPVLTGSELTEVDTYSMLVSNTSLTTLFDSLRAQMQQDAIFAYSGAYSVIWYYHINPTLIPIGTLDTLILQLESVESQFQADYGDPNALNDVAYTSPYITHMSLTSPLLTTAGTPGALENFRNRISVAQIPIAVLAIMVMVLILFFVSLMTGLLVERQSDAIALLRSRGASTGQVFWALMTQSISLGILALLLGVPLSIFTVYALSERTLPAGSQDALNVLTTNASPLIQTGILYALSIVIIVLLTMSISLFSAARLDVLALRRQLSSRTQRRPLWQRLNLDILAAIIALGGYGLSFYVTSLGGSLQDDTQTLIATPLSIIAPFFLIIGCMFLFLRIFPLILALMTFLVVRGRGAVSMLALAQIGRSPRHAIRMALLLALATAFALFTLVYIASQAQHIQDISIYDVGADFSGQYPTSNNHDTANVNALYSHIPGVLAASSGYTGVFNGGKAGITLDLRAVDASTFASSVIWPSTQEKKVGTTLLAQEVRQRNDAIAHGMAPAIIDTYTAQKLYLHVGSPLIVRMPGLYARNLQTVVIGIVPHIPTVNDRIGVGGLTSAIPGSILIDYSTYVDIYNGILKQKISANAPAVNTVWLHTRSDNDSLATVRLDLKQPTRALLYLQDRWAIISSLHSDPLYLILSGLLIIGTITALLLGLVGALLASWLSARVRLTNFAVLRAIGTTPREVANMLTYEQGLIYVTGLLLGIGFGALLSITIIPSLSLTDINSTLADSNQFYALQTAFPTHIIIPPTLLWGLLIVIILFSVALTMMVRIVSRPIMSQTLRLDED